MKTIKYLVSVVVPTHNRSKYAIHCISGLLGIKSEKIEVIVHDTSDDACDLATWVKEQRDGRLKYVHWKERLSMTENHERAIALASGEYVCLIGDDDSVSEKIIEIAEYAKQKGIDILTPSVKVMYSWPDFRTRFYRQAHAGKVYLKKYNCKVVKKNSHEQLNHALRNACQGTDELPKLYHGLVKRSLVDRMREKNGSIFYGTSPDMSAAVGLALTTEYYHVIDFPFTIPGASIGSNTGRSALNKHKGDIDKDPHMKPFKNLRWIESIPKFFSVETVWADAALQTLLNANRKDLFCSFNFSRLYALCLFRHYGYFHKTFEAKKYLLFSSETKIENNYNIYLEILKVVGCFLWQKFIRITSPWPSNGMRVLGVVDNVEKARILVDNSLCVNNFK